MPVEKISQQQHLLRGSQKNAYKPSYNNSARTYTKLQYLDHVQALTLPKSYETNFSVGGFPASYSESKENRLHGLVHTFSLCDNSFNGGIKGQQRERTQE